MRIKFLLQLTIKRDTWSWRRERYKFFLQRCDDGNAGIGVFESEDMASKNINEERILELGVFLSFESQNFELATQNSEFATQNSEFATQNSEFVTQNSEF